LPYGGVRLLRSTLRAVGGSWDVARFRRGERRREEVRRDCIQCQCLFKLDAICYARA
jgi:hypothetical protein